MNGLIVEGTTIRSKEYYDIMSRLRGGPETFQTADPIEIERGKQSLEEYKEFFLKQRKETINESEYIHLKKATIYPSGLPSAYVTMTPWRGKTSSIDAWSIETITPEI